MRWFVLGVFALVSFVWAPHADACSCMRQSPEEAIAAAEALFEGTVTAISTNDETPFRGRAVSLTVNRAWKGVTGTAVTVATASNSAACGYPFQDGETYLVYGYRTRSGDIQVSLCSHTKPITDAKADLKLLGKPDPALTEKGEPSDDGGRCSASLPGAATPNPAGFLMALGALALARRRR